MVSKPVSMRVSGTRGEGKSFQMMKSHFELTAQMKYLDKIRKDKGNEDAAWAKIIMDSWVGQNKEQARKWNESKPKSQEEIPFEPQPVDPPKPKKIRKPRKKKEEPAPPKKRDKWETVKV